MYFFWKLSVQVLCPFLKWIDCFHCEVLKIAYIFWIVILVRYVAHNFLWCSIGHLFTFDHFLSCADSICLVLLFPETPILWKSLPKSWLLFWYVRVFLLHFHPEMSQSHVSNLCFWSILNLFLHMMKGMDILYIYIIDTYIYSVLSTLCWRDYPYSTVWFEHFCKKKSVLCS